MELKTDGDHKQLLTDVIKKQIIVLGPDITLAKARNVPGLTVADDGTVTNISGDPKEVTQKLIEQFMELSGLIVKKTMEPLLANYPTLAAKETAQQPVQPPTPQAPPQPQQPPQPAPQSQSPEQSNITKEPGR